MQKVNIFGASPPSRSEGSAAGRRRRKPNSVPSRRRFPRGLAVAPEPVHDHRRRPVDGTRGDVDQRPAVGAAVDCRTESAYRMGIEDHRGDLQERTRGVDGVPLAFFRSESRSISWRSPDQGSIWALLRGQSDRSFGCRRSLKRRAEAGRGSRYRSPADRGTPRCRTSCPIRSVPSAPPTTAR
jgi:hypothetical protein